MIKNIFAIIGVITSLVMILGLTNKPKVATVQAKTKKSQITETKIPMTKEYYNLINKNKASKKQKPVVNDNITETKISMTKEYKQLITVE